MEQVFPPPLPWEATLFCSAVQQMVAANDGSSHSQPAASGPAQTTTTTPVHSPAGLPGAADVGVVEQHITWIHGHIPECEPAAYVVAFVYIRRFLEKQESRGLHVRVSSSNFQTLVLLTIMLASKSLTQRVYSNADFAVLAGMRTADINELERRFLSALSFDLHVDTEHYESGYTYLECIHGEVTLKRTRETAELEQSLLAARLERSRLLG